MHASVVVFPGTNSDAEMIHALRNVLGLKVTEVFHTEVDLPPGTDVVALPGGFSYGDYLRAGALAKGGAIVPAVLRHAAQGGVVLGICNGFQILTEVGLLPGALCRNEQRRFECREVYVRAESRGPATKEPGKVHRLPIAHADGRYVADNQTLDRLRGEGLIAFSYCDAQGNVAPSANPNGSVASIAGIYGGPRRNVLGMMPHPERVCDSAVGPALGLPILQDLLSALG